MGVDCLLVYPYFLAYDRTQRRIRSPLPPLGLMYIASALRNAGFTVEILDCTFLSGIEEAKTLLEAQDTKVVGFYSMITITRHSVELARRSKARGKIVIVGGPDASLTPEKYLSKGCYDYVVIGEGEVTIVELMKCILNGGLPDSVKGLAYRNGRGEFVRTGPREPIRNQDEIPSPSRDLINNEKYIEVWRSDHGYAMTTIMTSRGCPYGCNFCSNHIAPFGRRYYYRTPANIADELVEITRKWGYDRVWIADDVFTIVKKQTIDTCAEIVRRGLNFKWSCLTRADRVDDEILRAMKAAGCEIIFFGVESGAQYILDVMNRSMTLEQIVKGTQAAKKAGIRIHTFLQVGYPGETYKSIQDTIRFVKNISPDEFSFTVSYPLPGTTLHSIVETLDTDGEWLNQGENRLLFKSDIPERALRFAIWKAKYEFYANRRAAQSHRIYSRQTFKVLGTVFKIPTDIILKLSIPRSHWEPRPSRCDVFSRVVSKNDLR